MALFLGHGAVGHLFAGETLPHACRRGAQSALIAARAAAAREAGCTWLVGEAGAEKYGQHNPSLHNQLRAGLTARYRRPVWRWQPQSSHPAGERLAGEPDSPVAREPDVAYPQRRGAAGRP